MARWKPPPPAKIYEALTAVADGRVRRTDESRAEVVSSDGTRTYMVRWSPDRKQIASNDNASIWQGYTGYPIIAVLMALGELDYRPEIAALLAGLPWKQINRRVRNDWDRAVEETLAELRARGVDTEAIREEVKRLGEKLEGLELEKLPGRGGGSRREG
ncbi:MAG: hypothetical protein C4524_08980 [Candidatus Zixiibacteriota bacterium]|nr:MAG: hypothetical protein C4524_08980 [candidate division Zixibacteria bacterium]